MPGEDLKSQDITNFQALQEKNGGATEQNLQIPQSQSPVSTGKSTIILYIGLILMCLSVIAAAIILLLQGSLLKF